MSSVPPPIDDHDSHDHNSHDHNSDDDNSDDHDRQDYHRQDYHRQDYRSLDRITDGQADGLAAVPTLTRDDVAHLAQLARLELSDAELDLYVGQLSVILDAVATVGTVAASDADIEPTSHAVPLSNVYRQDVVRPGLTHEAALAGAPATDEGRFRVPQILGEEL